MDDDFDLIEMLDGDPSLDVPQTTKQVVQGNMYHFCSKCKLSSPRSITYCVGCGHIMPNYSKYLKETRQR